MTPSQATFDPTMIERGSAWRGYRWVPAVFIRVCNGTLYPPMQVREAREYCREHGLKVIKNEKTDSKVR